MAVQIVNKLPDEMVADIKAQKYQPTWVEGIDPVSYWPQGDTFIFTGKKHCMAISRDFLEELLYAAAKGGEGE